MFIMLVNMNPSDEIASIINNYLHLLRKMQVMLACKTDLKISHLEKFIQ